MRVIKKEDKEFCLQRIRILSFERFSVGTGLGAEWN